MTKITEELQKRFWSKVNIPLDENGNPDKDKCWVWTANKIKSGYGHFSINSRVIGAHRIAYLLVNHE